jgi:hypothetical protein
MAEAPSDPVAGDAAGIDFNGFGHFDRHGTLFQIGFLAGRRIIILTV